MDTSAGELDVALGKAPVEWVVFRGERLEIRPFTIVQLGEFVRLAKPLIDLVMDAQRDLDGDGAIVDLIVEAVAEHTASAIQAAALVTRQPAEWIGEGDPAEFLLLAQAIYRINRRFFTERLRPVLAELLPALGGAFAGVGRTVSSSSSSTATP